jgi:hypothetical protein
MNRHFMTHLTQSRIERTLALIIKTALANERCPANAYGTGIESAVLTRLAKTGWLRVEYSSLNFRCVHILKGEHAGKSTAPDTSGNKIYAILDKDGIRRLAVVDNSHRTARRQPGLAKLNFMERKETA